MDSDTLGRVGIGIVGAGRKNVATECHLPACLVSEKVQLVALCDQLESVHDYARSCSVRAYTDYDRMLADPGVEMVQIATPDWCHCDQAEQALGAGKHVLLQKPPCISMDELARLRYASLHSGASPALYPYFRRDYISHL